MTTPRLPFLYPMLFRSVRTAERATVRNAQKARSSKAPPSSSSIRFSTSSRRRVASPRQRYGPAQEPLPHLTGSNSGPAKQMGKSEGDTADRGAASTGGGAGGRSGEEAAGSTSEEQTPIPAPAGGDHPAVGSRPGPGEGRNVSPAAEGSRPLDAKPLETVLHMPSPAEENQRRPPYLQPPPYVHHFDTFSLVKQLEQSGFSQDQSITIMKAVRALLMKNMELARDGLVSKSNVENESYLFRAACSELRTEIQNNRKAQTEKMRSERGQLQHEVDILSQKMTQEIQQMKDAIKGMFDDRKMEVNMERRHTDSAIQEINYRITVALNSDARSDVEGLRWVLTRRAAVAIAVCAVMILSTLKYASYMTQAQAKEREKLAKELKATQIGAEGDASSASSSSSPSSSPPSHTNGDAGGNGVPTVPTSSDARVFAPDLLLVSEGGGQLG